MAGYEHLHWTSADGIRLHARDYAGRADRPPIVCLPGLTRNARDFAAVAERLAGEWRVIAVDLRGRGESGHAKDAMRYVPATYVDDVLALLGELAVDRYVAFGTSLGGLVTMLLAGRPGPRVAAALLNDVGPVVEPAGLSRIRSYVGRSATYPTWMHAARATAEANAEVYPHFDIEDWLAMAKRIHRLNSSGRVVLDYDMKIAEPFKGSNDEAASADPWPVVESLKDRPVLIVRGERSDMLSAATAQRMQQELPQADLVTVAATGHAPLLTEANVVAAIDRLLARVPGAR